MEMIGHRTPAENERARIIDYDSMVSPSDDAKDENGTVNTSKSSPNTQ